MTSFIENYLLIIPRAGFNDVLNQIQRGIDESKTLSLTPVICLEAHEQYRMPLSKLIDLGEPEIMDYSALDIKIGKPTLDEINRLNLDERTPRNRVVVNRGINYYFGSKGGLKDSYRLLKRAKLSSDLEPIMTRELELVDLQSLAVHIRCGDVYPNQREIKKVRSIAKKRNITVYSDCNGDSLFPGVSLDFGFPGRNPYLSEEKNTNNRSGEDVVSLYLLSKHHEIRLTQFNEIPHGNLYFGYRYSGFGKLALLMNLDSKRAENRLGIPAIRPMLTLLLRGPRDFFEICEILMTNKHQE